MGTGFVGSIAAMSFLVAGITYGRFSSTGFSATNSFSSGTVSVGSASVTQACAVPGVLPGTSSSTGCTFHITYNGNVNAYLAADILVVGGDATHSALWDGTINGLQLTVSDGSHGYTVPTSTLSCASVGAQFGASATNGKACGEIDNDTLTTAEVGNGTAYILTLNWSLPTASTNSNQGGNAQVFVSFHAVQSDNNALNCTQSPHSGTVGQQCTLSSPFKWS